MSPAVKVLVCGNLDGRFNQVFKRVDSVNKKNGPFDFLLCCGTFFGDTNDEWSAYRNGTRRVPLPTYVLGSTSSLPPHLVEPGSDELCPDVTALGERGVFTTSSGLGVAYLGSSQQAAEPSEADVSALAQSVAASRSPNIDILVTTAWPRGVTRYAMQPLGVYSEETGSPAAARLLHTLRPRYVFSGGLALHYERLPYRNHQVLRDQQSHVTRFISLAAAGNAEKQKWLYAFSLEPMVMMPRAALIAQPADVTECPFNAEEMAAAAASEDGSNRQYFYNMESGKGDGPKPKRRRQDGSEGGRQPATPCWFCLASPEVEKHLVVHVGEKCYLALAKGGLVADHVLILPVEHVRASTEADDDVWDEIISYKDRLRQMFAGDGRSVVFFERNYRQSHLQVQCVPVPARLSGALKEAVQDHCDGEGVALVELPPLSDVRQLAPPGAPYFYVELPGGEKFFHRIEKKFPLNIGRSMLACPPLLNRPGRVDWRDCEVSKEDQTAVAKEFKAKFKKVA